MRRKRKKGKKVATSKKHLQAHADKVLHTKASAEYKTSTFNKNFVGEAGAASGRGVNGTVVGLMQVIAGTFYLRLLFRFLAILSVFITFFLCAFAFLWVRILRILRILRFSRSCTALWRQYFCPYFIHTDTRVSRRIHVTSARRLSHAHSAPLLWILVGVMLFSAFPMALDRHIRFSSVQFS